MHSTAYKGTAIRIQGRLVRTGLAVLAAVAMTAASARATDYYVSATGNNANDGLSVDTAKATVEAAVTTANGAAGYHTINIGAGTFNMAARAYPSKSMRIVGAGPTQTFLDRADYTFDLTSVPATGAGSPSAVEPIVFKDFMQSNATGGDNTGYVWLFATDLNYVQVDNVSLDGYRRMMYGIYLNAGAATTGLDYWTIKQLVYANTSGKAVDTTPWYHYWFRFDGTGARFELKDWVWDTCAITNNPGFWGSDNEGRFYANGWTLKDSTWSRNGFRGYYSLNMSYRSADGLYRGILGTNVIDNCTIEDNCQWGVNATFMGTNASLIIKNSTIRDTSATNVVGYGSNPAPSSEPQSIGVYITTISGVPINQIRAINTQFGGSNTYGIYIIDRGATQLYPIELKNVNFNDCATGLVIVSSAYVPTNSLWYIDPTQSGASNGVVKVSGGRMTRYGDANLDGIVNGEDTAYVGTNFIASGAVWTNGDFDFDGDYDAADKVYLPTICYVRADGNDTYNGLAAVWDGVNGPDATPLGGVDDADVAPSNAVDIGAGTFSISATLDPAGTANFMSIYGDAGGGTVLERTANVYMLGGDWMGPVASPVMLKNLTFKDSLGSAGTTVIRWAPYPEMLKPFTPPLAYTYCVFSNVNLSSFNCSGAYIFDFNYNATYTNIVNLKSRNLTITNNTVSSMIKPSSGGSRITCVWDFEDVTWAYNTGGFYYDPAGRNYQGLLNSILRRVTYTCNSSAFDAYKTADTMLVDNSTFSDNNGTGLTLGTLQNPLWYDGVNGRPSANTPITVTITNCTFAESGAGQVQTVGASMTVPSGRVLGNIRVIGGTWTNLTTGIAITDNGGVQTSPIELKNVNFGNLTTGVAIGGSSANLWYIDPIQSGATNNGTGTIITGGRKTYYGDADLDGKVSFADREYVGAYPKTSGATWATGDFDFDGDFDAVDLAWLPLRGKGAVMILK